MLTLSQVASHRKPSRIVKPTRVAPRREAAFGEGLEEQGLACPIDLRPLPMINGQGLTSDELNRVCRAKARAWHSYATDCPEATLPECDVVARKAAHDELRRLLMERPAAPPLAPVVEVEPEDAVEPVPVPAVSPRHASSVPAPKFARRRIHDRGDETWWTIRRDAEERGLVDLTDREEPDDELTMSEWLESSAPCSLPDFEHAQSQYLSHAEA